MTPRRLNLPLTYGPKIEPVRRGECTQSIRVLVDHPCKCKGQDLGLWKHGESPHHSSGSRKICQRCGGTGTIPARPKQIGDLVRFYRWTGRPYWSSPEYLTGYMPLTEVVDIWIMIDGISGLIVQHDSQRPILTEWKHLEYLARLDGIVPPTGEALRDVLVQKNGKIPAAGLAAQVLRWKPEGLNEQKTMEVI